MTADVSLFHVDRLELRFEQKSWRFAQERRDEIAAYFAELQRQKPAIWNGRILLLHHHEIDGGAFRGAYLETDYASFSAWSAWGMPPAGVCNCFGAAAIIAADNAVLLGVMGAHTANAGLIYFPCGTPDPNDVFDGKVDLGASVVRELAEETGCEIDAFAVEPGWIVVRQGDRIAQIKVLRSAETADALRVRMLEHLAREEQPELADIYIVRGSRDYRPAMPAYVIAFLEHHFDRA